MTTPPSPAGPNVGRDDQAGGGAAPSEPWGQPIARPRDMEQIALLHRTVGETGRAIDDTTWADLDMDNVFAALDRTVGMPGRQVLYHRLRTYCADDAVLAERARQHAIFRRDRPLRERIQSLLRRLDRPGAGYIASLVMGQLPAVPKHAWALFVLSVLTPACLVGMLFFHPLLIPALALLCTNAAIYASYGQRIIPNFSGFAQINTMLETADRLGRIRDEHTLPPLTTLRDSAGLIAELRRQLGWLVIDRAALPDLVQSLFGYLNMLFLFDIVIFLRSVRVLRKNQPVFARIFDAVGSLDAAISVASFHDGVPVITLPTLTDRREIEAVELYHPLIAEPVANDFQLHERSALIAGPNMAGKTAFIRTVGINLILARTLHFCLARHATLPRAIVRSAIRREDHLSDGQSYFFAEIQQVLDFTRCDDAGPLHLFLIDEIFRGTNTVERIASSAAVLRHLGRHHFVCATTHDIELQEILGDAFAMYHFSDDVTDGKYGFDYRLQPGPVRSRNAIRLLEITGYPPAVVREAEQLARWFDARSLSAGPVMPPASPAPERDAAGRDGAGPPNNAHDSGASVSATGIR